MAGMRALGRVYDRIPNASGVAVCLRDCSGVGITAVTTSTLATSLAFTAATSFGGTYVAVQPSNGFGQPNTWYQRTAPTAAWTAVTGSSVVWTANSLTIAGTINYVSYLDFLVSELADQYEYLKVTATNATIDLALYDLTVQRTPANLRIPSA